MNNERVLLAYALGMLKGAGVEYPSWMDDAVFDVEEEAPLAGAGTFTMPYGAGTLSWPADQTPPPYIVTNSSEGRK